MVWGRKRIDIEGRLFHICSNFASEVCTTQIALTHPLQHFTISPSEAFSTFPGRCAIPTCVFLRHLVCCCVLGVSGSSRVCFHGCPCPKGEGPAWSPCVVLALAQRSPEHLTAHRDCSLPGRAKEPSTRAGRWTSPRKVLQEVILMCFSVQRQPRRSGPWKHPSAQLRDLAGGP